MIAYLYSVQDRLSGYMQVTTEVNDQVAYRNFEHAVLHGGSVLSSHSQDYQLVKLASFDTDTGIIAPLSPVEVIATGQSIFLSDLRRSGDHDF